ncbi:MAG: Flp pilus assembly complex ATPase component TadA [Pirellulales bacterium]|nr:Flp pilus assembly complex ATPase component TadA [Pirellulales bacterium]
MNDWDPIDDLANLHGTGAEPFDGSDFEPATVFDSGRTATAVLDPGLAVRKSTMPRTALRPPAPVPLGQLLLEGGVISTEQLETALSKGTEKGLRLGEALLDMGFVQEEAILPYIEQHLGVPTVRLREGIVDPQVVKRIPRSIAESLGCLALFKIRDTLSVAMAEPQNLQQTDELEQITGLSIRPVFAFRMSIERILPRCYEENFEVDTVTADLDESAIQLQTDDTDADLTNLEALVDGSPIINLVNYLLIQAIRSGASDIHIEPSRKYSIVRFRVDGQLHEALRPRRDMHPAIVSRIKVMSKMDIAEHNRPQDGRFQVMVEGREIDFRISSLPTVLGEKVVLRILDRDKLTFNLDMLGLPARMLVQLKELLAKPYGLLLVTGPTGSGKTTTLYSALELVKSVHHNVVTVEDPVEYQVELVNQVQVDEGRNVLFSDVLRSILRQDPDIIMIGEIRDGDTAQIAIQAALTGHLVLSTLHTNDSAGAVNRLVDMGVESYKVAAALIGVVAQRLVRTICPHCSSISYPTAELLEMIHFKGDRRRSFVRGTGCQQCHDTGFRGRTGIYEVMSIDRELREMIATGATIDQIRDVYRGKGGETLLEQGILLAEQEKTSLEEVIRVAYFE